MVEGRPFPPKHNKTKDIQGSSEGYHISQAEWDDLQALSEPLHPRKHDLDSTDDHEGTLSEGKVDFDITSGHAHTGVESRKVSYNDLNNVPSTFPPVSHASKHEVGGSDEIDVTGLAGVLTDAQVPQDHDLDSGHTTGTINESRVCFGSGVGHAHSGSSGDGRQVSHMFLRQQYPIGIAPNAFHITEDLYNALVGAVSALSGSNPVVDTETFNLATLGFKIRLSVKNFYDPTSGLPTPSAVGEGYIATATGSGWTKNNAYFWNGITWDEEVTDRGDMRGVTDLASIYVFSVNDTWEFILASITDHGSLTGLGDDDHPHYHNDTRGDMRYYQQADADTMVDNKVAVHSAITDAHHSRYADTEARTAMGVKDNSNPYHHDRYRDGDAEAVANTVVATHTADENAHHNRRHGFNSVDDHEPFVGALKKGKVVYIGPTGYLTASDVGVVHDDILTIGNVHESDIIDLDKYSQAEVDLKDSAVEATIPIHIASHASVTDAHHSKTASVTELTDHDELMSHENYPTMDGLMDWHIFDVYTAPPSPPFSPKGICILVAPSETSGDFVGHENELCWTKDGFVTYHFIQPTEGLLRYLWKDTSGYLGLGDNVPVIWNGTAWVKFDKINAVSGGAGNFPEITTDGQLSNSGYSASDFIGKIGKKEFIEADIVDGLVPLVAVNNGVLKNGLQIALPDIGDGYRFAPITCPPLLWELTDNYSPKFQYLVRREGDSGTGNVTIRLAIQFRDQGSKVTFRYVTSKTVTISNSSFIRVPTEMTPFPISPMFIRYVEITVVDIDASLVSSGGVRIDGVNHVGWKVK